MSLRQTDLVLLFLLLQFLQTKADLLLDLMRLFEFLFSFHAHVLEVVHHFDLLLKSSHLDLDLDGLFLELCVSKGLRGNEMRLVLAQFVLEATWRNNYV